MTESLLSDNEKLVVLLTKLVELLDALVVLFFLENNIWKFENVFVFSFENDFVL